VSALGGHGRGADLGVDLEPDGSFTALSGGRDMTLRHQYRQASPNRAVTSTAHRCQGGLGGHGVCPGFAGKLGQRQQDHFLHGGESLHGPDARQLMPRHAATSVRAMKVRSRLIVPRCTRTRPSASPRRAR